MRTLSALTAGAAALVASTVSAEARSSADPALPPGVVQWPIERRDATALPNGGVALRPRRRGMPVSIGRRDRQVGNTYEEIVTNERFRGGYFSTTQVGTPGQPLTLQLDTGSSDIWVPHFAADVCQRATRQSNGCSFGSCMRYHPLLLLGPAAARF